MPDRQFKALKLVNMFIYYLKIAIRILIRNKIYSIINIIGLSLGLAFSLLMLLLVYQELSFDTFHKNYDNLYILQQDVKMETGWFTTDRAGALMSKAIKEAFTEVKSTTRYGELKEVLIKTNESNHDQVSFLADRGIAADSTFFELFSFNFISGSPEKALIEPKNMVVTKSFAEKLFGKTPAKGEKLTINKTHEFTVSAVIDDVPDNSSITFDFIVPFDFQKEIESLPLDTYTGTNFFNFVLLNKNANVDELNRKIPPLFKGLYDAPIETKLYLTPIADLHLYGENLNFIGTFSVVILALLILTIACINFVNLSTALASTRIKEVGIRKTIGGNRANLIKQFMTESFLTVCISFILALGIVENTTTMINSEFQTDISIEYFNPRFIVLFILLFILTGIASGSYPAFLLSMFKPVDMFGSSKRFIVRGAKFRKILVVVQFTFAIIFVLIAITIYRQLNYMPKADFGFDTKDIIYIKAKGNLRNNYQAFKEQLLLNSNIKYVSTGSSIPNNADYGEVHWGVKSDEYNVIARIIFAGYDFEKVFGLKLEKGSFYTLNTDNADSFLVINSAAVKYLGYKNPIGKDIYLYGKRRTIIGVIEDIQFFPFNIGSKALLLPFEKNEEYVFIKTNNGNEDILNQIRQIAVGIEPDYPFDYFYLDQYKLPLLKNIDVINYTMLLVTCFGIFISCMGLFGLSTFSIKRQTKEIGIKKTLGADNFTIILSLSKQFLKLVALACVIAMPVAWFLLQKILSFFSYAVNISVWIFVVTTFAVLIISQLTVFYHAYRAAKSNPTESLRYE